MGIKIDAGDYKRGEVFLVDPREIESDEQFNGRHFRVSDEAIDAMVRSFGERGQLQPIRCRKVAGSNRIHAVAGFTRLRASLKMVEKNPEFRIKVTVEANLNDQDAFLANLEENNARNELSLVDHAYNMARLQSWGWNNERIAEFYRMSPTKVSNILSLKGCHEKIQRLVADRRMGLSNALSTRGLDNDEIELIYQQNMAKNGLEIEEFGPDGAPIPRTLLPALAAPAPSNNPAPDAIRPENPDVKANGKPNVKYDPMTGRPIKTKKDKKAKPKKTTGAELRNLRRKKGEVVPRSLKEFKDVIKDYPHDICKVILSYLAGTSDEDALRDAIDATHMIAVETI